jgi:hypothetical protein
MGGAGNIIFYSRGGPVKRNKPLMRVAQVKPEGRHLFLEIPSRGSIVFIYFWGSNKKGRWAGGGGAAPLLRVNQPKKTSARTRGLNPLVATNTAELGKKLGMH